MKRTSQRGLYAPELLEPRIAPATFLVTNLADDGTDGTLRKEIADANAQAGADTITFAPSLFPNGLSGIVRLAGAAEIPITGPLTIKGPGIDLLTITGVNASRIFDIDDPAALSPTIISGLTLTNGKSPAGTDGGAIRSVEPLTLKNVVVRSSYAADEGGGIFVDTPGKVSISGSRILHNEAADSAGGLYLIARAGISIVKSTIAGNTAVEMGGIYAFTDVAKSVILIDNCIIAGNTATSGGGGGMVLYGVDDGKILIKKSLITGNSATDSGGAVLLEEGNLVITGSTFSNNTAAIGGAIADSDARSLSISGSRFIANRTDDPGNGGGAALYLSDSVASVTSSLFSGNTSPYTGGAILVGPGADFTMKGSTLTGNVASVFEGGALAALGGSVVNLIGNKFTENRAKNDGGAIWMGGAVIPAQVNLSGNLFQGNFSETEGGAIMAVQASILTSKSDKFIGNVALDQGGAAYLDNSGASTITGSLFQGNVAGGSGGGIRVLGSYVFTGVKILDNVAGEGGRGGGMRISGGPVSIIKSVITGNVANDGGGIFYNVGTTTRDAATVIRGNAAGINQNIGTA